MATPPATTPPAAGGGKVDNTSLNQAAAAAKQLYGEVQALAIAYEQQTAGAKLGKDKAKSISS